MDITITSELEINFRKLVSLSLKNFFDEQILFFRDYHKKRTKNTFPEFHFFSFLRIIHLIRVSPKKNFVNTKNFGRHKKNLDGTKKFWSAQKNFGRHKKFWSAQKNFKNIECSNMDFNGTLLAPLIVK